MFKNGEALCNLLFRDYIWVAPFWMPMFLWHIKFKILAHTGSCHIYLSVFLFSFAVLLIGRLSDLQFMWFINLWIQEKNINGEKHLAHIDSMSNPKLCFKHFLVKSMCESVYPAPPSLYFTITVTIPLLDLSRKYYVSHRARWLNILFLWVFLKVIFFGVSVRL